MKNNKEELWKVADSVFKYALSVDKKKYKKNPNTFKKRVVSVYCRGWSFLNAPKPDFDALEKLLDDYKFPL